MRTAITLRTIAERGQTLRVWCFRCARGEEMDAGVWIRFDRRGWPQELPACSRHFRCRSCRRSDEVLVLPTGRIMTREWSTADAVALLFHGLRSQKKKARRLV